MKRIKNIVILLFSIFIVSGCQSNQLGEESPYGNSVNHLEGVSIELNAATYLPEENQIELTVMNHSGEEITYGVPYTLEFLKDDTWYIVEPEEELAFIMIAYILASGEEETEGINLEPYEPLDVGEYRIIRIINGGPLSAEFKVEDE